MDWTTVVIAVATFLVTALYLKTRRRPNFPPGPTARPFFGHVHLINKKFHQTADELFKKFGPIIGLQMVTHPAIILSDVSVIKAALHDKADYFSSRPTWLPFLKNFGAKFGIAFSSGATWKTNRKLTLTSMRELGFGGSTLESKVSAEVEDLLSEVEKGVGRQDFQFGTLFHKATSNVICTLSWGQRYNYDHPEFRDFLDKLEYLFSHAGFQNIFLFLPNYFRILAPLIKPEAIKFVRDDRAMRKVLMTKVKQHREEFDPNNIRDMMDLFIDSDQDDTQLVATIMDLFKAGSETVSTTLLWGIVFLMAYPEVQDKCRREIHKVVETDRLPCMADKDSLPYTCATIQEIQRLASVTPFTILHGTDVTCELLGYTIPSHTIVYINLFSLHMNPDYWDQPEVFKPERFLSEDRTQVLNPNAFMPFGYGRRSCLGDTVAKMELFLLLTALLARFQFSSRDKTKLPRVEDANLGLTLAPAKYVLQVEKV